MTWYGFFIKNMNQIQTAGVLFYFCSLSFKYMWIPEEESDWFGSLSNSIPTMKLVQ